MVKRFSQKDEKIILVFLPVFNMPLSVQIYTFSSILFSCLEILTAYLNPIERFTRLMHIKPNNYCRMIKH